MAKKEPVVEKNDESIVAVQMPPVAYSVTDASLGELAEKYKVVPDASTNEGMEEIKDCLREMVPLRTGIEKARKELKADALEYGRKVDDEAKRVTAKLLEIETPFQDAKKEEYEREEKEKAAALKLEMERVESIEQRISGIRNMAWNLNVDAKTLASLLKSAEDLVITEDDYEEYYEQALDARGNVVSTIRTAYEARVELESRQAQQAEEEKRLQADRDALAKERAELDKERQKAADEKAKLEQEKVAAQEREAAAKKAEADRIAAEEAEKERVAAEQAEAERKAAEEAQAAKDAEAARKKEAARLKKLKPQVDKVVDFLDDIKISLLEAPKLKDEALNERLQSFVAVSEAQISNFLNEIQ